MLHKAFTFNRALLLSAIFFMALLTNGGWGEIVVKDGESIAFMGDSITQNGWQHSYGYVNLIVSGLAAQGIKVTPIPAGISGNKSNDMLGRVEGHVLSKKPAWMTLSCGVNDVWHGERGVNLEDYKKNITAILDKAQAAGVKVVILTATMIGEKETDLNNQKAIPYNDFLRQIAKERSLPLADLNAAHNAGVKAIPADAPYRSLTTDGVHMNSHGDRMMAEGVLRTLGLNDEQIAKAKEAWLSKPDGCEVEIRNLKRTLSLRQYDGLEIYAAREKRRADELIIDIYDAAFAKASRANTSNPPDLTAIRNATKEIFSKDMDALLLAK